MSKQNCFPHTDHSPHSDNLTAVVIFQNMHFVVALHNKCIYVVRSHQMLTQEQGCHYAKGSRHMGFKPFLKCRLRSSSNCFSKVGWDHIRIVSRKSVCFTHTRVVKQIHSLSMSMQHKTCKWVQTCWSLKIRHDARLTRKLISGGWYADLDLEAFLCCLNLLWKPCPLSGPWQFA